MIAICVVVVAVLYGASHLSGQVVNDQLTDEAKSEKYWKGVREMNFFFRNLHFSGQGSRGFMLDTDTNA